MFLTKNDLPGINSIYIIELDYIITGGNLMARNRKVVAALLVLAMLCSILFTNAGSMVTYASSAQTLKFDFEDGKLGSWIARFNAGKIVVSDEKAHEGTKSLKASEVGEGWKGPFYDLQSLAVKDRTFTVSAWVMQNSGSAKILTMQAETTKQSAAIYDKKEIASGVWTEFKGTFKLSEADLGKCDFWIQGENATEFYVDDVTISYEGGEDPLKTISIINSNFDNGEDGWQARVAKIETTSEVAHGDTGKSLKISGRTQNWQGTQFDVSELFKAGSKYTFSAWAFQKSGADQKINISVQNEKAGTDTSYPQVTEVSIPSDKWTQITAEYTHAGNFDKSYVYFQAPTADLEFYIDDVLVTSLAAKPASYQKDIVSLKDVLKNNFSIGMAVGGNYINPDDPNSVVIKGLVSKHFNSITCENEMKPDFVLDKNATLKAYKNDKDSMPQFDFTRGDQIVQFAKDNKMGVRGHTLVWHSQTPDWLFRQGYDENKPYVSRDIMLKRMNNYISTVMKHFETKFPGVVYAWDVVNEAIDPNTNDPNGLRKESNWYKVVGPDYIQQAFKFADAAVKELKKKDAKGNRSIKLFYNDYSTEDTAKRAAIEKLCASLKKQGIIDGVGLQSHQKSAAPTVEAIAKSIDDMAKLGLEVQITELDVDMHIESESDSVAQGYRYKEMFDLFKSKKAVTNVTIWGLTDDRTWLRGSVGLEHSDPLLFDADFQAKPAFWGIADPSQLPIYTNTVKVYKGTPSKVDGKTELAYGVQAITNIDSSTSSTFNAAWDDNNLYLLINVADATKDKTDAVEIMADNNGKSTSFTVTRANKVTGATVVSKVVDSKKGYTLEVKIPMKDLKLNNSVGLDIVIKDGKKQYVWNDKKYTGKKVVANYGKLLLKAMPKLTEAIKGSAKIDAKIDASWAKAKEIKVNNFSAGTTGATATVKTMWDENYIYILANVKDSVLNDSSGNVWEQDSLEVFIDENNAKTVTYQADDVQYRVNYKNLKTITSGLDVKSFDSATVKTKEGYIVEMRIPKLIAKFKAGQLIGFDAQVNNSDDKGARVSITNWNDLTGQGYCNTESFGILKLITK